MISTAKARGTTSDYKYVPRRQFRQCIVSGAVDSNGNASVLKHYSSVYYIKHLARFITSFAANAQFSMPAYTPDATTESLDANQNVYWKLAPGTTVTGIGDNYGYLNISGDSRGCVCATDLLTANAPVQYDPDGFTDRFWFKPTDATKLAGRVIFGAVNSAGHGVVIAVSPLGYVTISINSCGNTRAAELADGSNLQTITGNGFFTTNFKITDAANINREISFILRRDTESYKFYIDGEVVFSATTQLVVCTIDRRFFGGTGQFTDQGWTGQARTAAWGKVKEYTHTSTAISPTVPTAATAFEVSTDITVNPMVFTVPVSSEHDMLVRYNGSQVHQTLPTNARSYVYLDVDEHSGEITEGFTAVPCRYSPVYRDDGWGSLGINGVAGEIYDRYSRYWYERAGSVLSPVSFVPGNSVSQYSGGTADNPYTGGAVAAIRIPVGGGIVSGIQELADEWSVALHLRNMTVTGLAAGVEQVILSFMTPTDEEGYGFKLTIDRGFIVRIYVSYNGTSWWKSGQVGGVDQIQLDGVPERILIVFRLNTIHFSFGNEVTSTGMSVTDQYTWFALTGAWTSVRQAFGATLRIGYGVGSGSKVTFDVVQCDVYPYAVRHEDFTWRVEIRHEGALSQGLPVYFVRYTPYKFPEEMCFYNTATHRMYRLGNFTGDKLTQSSQFSTALRLFVGEAHAYEDSIATLRTYPANGKFFSAWIGVVPDDHPTLGTAGESTNWSLSFQYSPNKSEGRLRPVPALTEIAGKQYGIDIRFFNTRAISVDVGADGVSRNDETGYIRVIATRDW